MTNQKTRVVVIGGGYAGTLAANHLELRDDVDVTLVNPRPEFVERIRLHQLAAGTRGATVGFDELLHDRVSLLVDSVDRIDAPNRTLELASRRELPYDYLVYAVGSTGDASPDVPGAGEFAHAVAELEYAQRLHAALEAVEPEAPIVVVGGGLTGVELASELAEQGRNVTLACGGELAPYLSSPGRRSMHAWFRRQGVDVLPDRVIEVREDSVVLHGGAVLPSAVTIWTAGFGVPNLADRSGLRTDELGRLLTDETLTSLDDDRVVAAGDAAAPSGEPLRMSCQAAGPLGVQAANTVLSRIAGNVPEPLDQRFVGACISLGRRGGIFQVARKDDRAVNLYVAGRPVAALKEAICNAVMSAITKEAKKPGSYFWLKAGTRNVHEKALAGS
ncbi:MAG: NAD(P)/FAD-dependent oxidoreductase [Aeromicrobium sp.]